MNRKKMAAAAALAIVVTVVCLGVIEGGPAQTPIEDKYKQEFDKLKDSSPYVFRNGSVIEYRIQSYNTDFEYYVRVYSAGHKAILREWKLTISPSENGRSVKGTVPFIYPTGQAQVHINLQQAMPEGKWIDLCKKYQYTSSWGQTGCCDIVKNLDIVTIGSSSKTEQTGPYVEDLRRYTRGETDKIPGASWQAMVNADKQAGGK
jgi:hypothetical protein